MQLSTQDSETVLHKMNNHEFRRDKYAYWTKPPAYLFFGYKSQNLEQGAFIVKNVKIIGLPVLVTDRHRIVLDKNIRTLYEMESDDIVVMKMVNGIIFVSPCKEGSPADGEEKMLSAGRFNLPQIWVKENQVEIGGFVYLIATDAGIALCAENMEIACVVEAE